jgi:hypothetical protein
MGTGTLRILIVDDSEPRGASSEQYCVRAIGSFAEKRRMAERVWRNFRNLNQT